MSAATTEWTTVKQRKMWAPPITASRLCREDATHPYLPPRQPEKKKAPEFPALPGVKKPAAAGTGLNFKDMARESAARFEREEAFRLAEQARMAREVSQAEIDRRRLLSRIPTRCYDDGPEDYDPPEDDDYEEDNYEENNYEQRGYDGGDEDEENEEENAIGYSYYMAHGMRRGQNEFW